MLQIFSSLLPFSFHCTLPGAYFLAVYLKKKPLILLVIKSNVFKDQSALTLLFFLMPSEDL